MEPLPLIRFFSFLTACISWLIFHCLLFGEPQDTRGSGSIWDASGLVPAPLVPVTLRLDQRTAPFLAVRTAPAFPFFRWGCGE